MLAELTKGSASDVQLLFDRPIEHGVPPLRLVSRFHYRRPPRGLARPSTADDAMDPRASATPIAALAPPRAPVISRLTTNGKSRGTEGTEGADDAEEGAAPSP